MRHFLKRHFIERHFLKRHFETAVFTAAITLAAAVIVWWFTFFHQLMSELKLTQTPQYARWRRMLLSEGSVMIVLLLICSIILWGVARQRQRAQAQLEQVMILSVHQLKTPLTGIQAFLQSLRLGRIPAGQQAHFVSQAEVACHRLEHLIESILTYQKTLLTALSSLTPQPAQALVLRVLEHRRATHPQEGLTLTLSQAPGAIQISDAIHAPVTIQADENAFRIVLENILDNAAKYGDPARPAQLFDECSAEHWILHIRDFGMGFSADNPLQDAIKPYQRRHSLHVQHGNGLGLYISARLMSQMGGKLTLTTPTQPTDSQGAQISLLFKRV